MSHPSIMRAFTKRQKRPKVSSPMPFHEGQVKYAPGTIQKSQISPAVELVSSTNVLVYTAPNLPNGKGSVTSSSSSSSTRPSTDDMDRPFRGSTPITSPEDSPYEVSPISADTDLSSFPFGSCKRSGSTNSRGHSRTSTSSSNEPPPIPQRALSHTKSHHNLGRQRSQKMAMPPTSISNVHHTRMAQDHSAPRASHPFRKELEQVNEVVEEFGGVVPVPDEEEQILLSKGLKKFSVDDYLYEIEDLYLTYFGDGPTIHDDVGGSWI